ncbi:MAG TPA: rhomboid family intramembrane serine protease [Actinomycetota bacterium]|nr:rhomboid family intramembrane serine protease [Actinomycetota bacterium]
MTTTETCYRHPGVITGVHCTRCGRPICTDCMIPAAVGYQCPTCVEDARREFRRGPGRPLRRGNLSATRVLLVLILIGFAIELAVGGPQALMTGPSECKLIQLGAMQPILIAHGQLWRLFAAMFLHAGLLHIAFNAYALYLFGTIVERDFGTARFLAIFFVTGLLAGVASYAFGSVGEVGVGASGAIFGIFGAFIAYNFRRRHLAMAAANLRWAMTLIVLNAVLAFGFSEIDWRAHVGGLVAGVIAGAAAEGVGTPSQRRMIALAGFLGLIALGVALLAWRTADIQGLPGFEQAARQILLQCSR